MRKHEAAECLGVSVRTFERLALKEGLTKGRERVKTRPCVTFDRSEVEALKGKLEGDGRSGTLARLVAEEPRDAIAFRLDPFYVRRLSEEGGKAGLSAQQYARKLVVQGLEDGQAEGLRRELLSLRSGLAELFFSVLVVSCGASEKEAQEFVNRALLSA